MKYKVGDKVLVKSLDWYYENRDKIDQVDCGSTCFVPPMVTFCGKIVTILSILPTLDVYHIKEDDGEFNWTGEMIEGLVERNGKIYPYKIGDRVVLKGRNRCATITDLKYNSWGNLSYYIKIDNDKDISTDYPTDLLLPYDNMIEEIVEEKTKPEPKFKVGDKVRLELYPCVVTTVEWKSDSEYVGYIYTVRGTDFGKKVKETDLVFKDIEEENKSNTIEEIKICQNSIKDILICPHGYQFVDENGNVINTTKIVLEKKKKEYPKTYEECCKVLGIPVHGGIALVGNWCMEDGYIVQHLETLRALSKLLICRDAYWKIAGEEMGLGKPWKPDWTDQESPKYCITSIKDQVEASKRYYIMNTILAFPTEEMRDAFYDNFKELIESCKELL